MYTLNLLEQAHDTILRSVEGLPIIGWYIPGVYGTWSVKDTVAHLTSCEYVLLDIFAEVKGSTYTPTLKRWLQDRQTFDAVEVKRRQDKTVESLLDEYNEVQSETLIQVIRIPDELLRRNGTLPWYDPDSDLEQFIASTYYHHKRTLGEHLAAFRDHIMPGVSEQVVSWPQN
jgi:uncharacterized damage-inducible protein DinB